MINFLLKSFNDCFCTSSSDKFLKIFKSSSLISFAKRKFVINSLTFSIQKHTHQLSEKSQARKKANPF